MITKEELAAGTRPEHKKKRQLADIRRRVARGAKLLDEKGPANWRKTLLLHLSELDLNSATSCVLGWAYRNRLGRIFISGFTAGMARLGLTAQEAESYGFLVCELRVTDEYDYLTAAWIRRLTLDAKKAAAASPAAP
jgi:hypothetical protein